jgi:hypothetical protein
VDKEILELYWNKYGILPLQATDSDARMCGKTSQDEYPQTTEVGKGGKDPGCLLKRGSRPLLNVQLDIWLTHSPRTKIRSIFIIFVWKQ